MRRFPMILGLATVATLAACSGGTPTAAPKKTTTTRPSATTTPPAPACTAASVSASVDFTNKTGGGSSTMAGAVRFSDTGANPCSLRGVPQVQVLGSTGQNMGIYQESATPAHVVPTTISPSAQAASSITFSSWTCDTTTMSLTVRFPGWSSSIPAAPDATSGTNTTNPCINSTETDQTVFMGPVIPVPPITG